MKDKRGGRGRDKYQEEETRKAQNIATTAGESTTWLLEPTHLMPIKIDSLTAEETLGWICQVPLRSDCDDRIVYSSSSVGLTQKLNRTRHYIYIMYEYQLFEQWSILHDVQYYSAQNELKTADKCKQMFNLPDIF